MVIETAAIAGTAHSMGASSARAATDLGIHRAIVLNMTPLLIGVPGDASAMGIWVKREIA
jgi:hypothetical protein